MMMILPAWAALSVVTAMACGETRQPATAAAVLSGHPGATTTRPAAQRPFDPHIGTTWIGNGICYGPHRDGQGPGGASPTREQLREDLRLFRERWALLRMYGAGDAAETVLDLIRQERLGMKVMLGAWIASEVRVGENGAIVEEFPQARAANAREVEAAIRLANAYPDIVVAVNVGNETQVFWSSHRVAVDTLIDYIRRVRAAVRVPVTTCDDFNYWNKSESRVVAAEIDFIVTHIYAMWAGQPLDRGLAFTREKHAEVAAMHPGHTVVIGEAGWATRRHNEGEQAKLIVGETGEDPQKVFYDQFVAWTTRERIVNFFFEAFDESWKGGSHPDEVEKHWGLFRSDRTPKKAIQKSP